MWYARPRSDDDRFYLITLPWVALLLLGQDMYREDFGHRDGEGRATALAARLTDIDSEKTALLRVRLFRLSPLRNTSAFPLIPLFKVP